jgi:hypothetical protein
MSDKPSRHNSEWLRQKLWPFPRRTSEGADSVLPHEEEFLEQSGHLGKRQESDEKPGRDRSKH